MRWEAFGSKLTLMNAATSHNVTNHINTVSYDRNLAHLAMGAFGFVQILPGVFNKYAKDSQGITGLIIQAVTHLECVSFHNLTTSETFFMTYADVVEALS